MEDEQTSTKDQEIGITHETTCNHEWAIALSQDPNSDMISYECTKCWSGKSISKELVKES